MSDVMLFAVVGYIMNIDEDVNNYHVSNCCTVSAPNVACLSGNYSSIT